MSAQLELDISAKAECAKQFSCPIRSVCDLVGKRDAGKIIFTFTPKGNNRRLQRTIDTHLKKHRPEPCRNPLNITHGNRVKRFWLKSTIAVRLAQKRESVFNDV